MIRITGLLFTIAVADHQEPNGGAETEQDETVFGFRVLGVGQEEGVLICECSLGLLEGDPMLAEVAGVLGSSHSNFRPFTSQL